MTGREEEMDEREEEPAAALPQPAPGPGPTPVVYGFDAAGFIHDLEDQLTGNVAGFSIGLNENGSTIAQPSWNWAKEPQDGGEAWTPDTRMHVASLSKIVTAIAMTKLLDEAGISPAAPIIGYLPAYWVKGPNVDQITFFDLLAHTSGLAFQTTNSRSDFEWMKYQIAVGTSTLNRGQYDYQNMNYGLCRILLATVNGNVPVDWLFPGWQGSPDSLWDCSTITAYASYVADEVFAPSGVSGPGFTHDPADALAYNFPVASNGWNSRDLTRMVGGAGWHMSVNELLQVMGTFRRGGTIVSPDQAQAMLEAGFGINCSVPTDVGTYYVKFGGWSRDSDQEEQCEAFFLPLNMELVVLVNSPVNGEPEGTTLYQWVKSAYLNNIVEAPPPNA
jgi:CubicO group peptidase (beta-lactamase class C family)